MGREISATMQSILNATAREIDYTVELIFPDATIFQYATAPLDISKGEYTNDVDAVKEIRQTLEAPTDGVSIALQNKDRVVGLHLAENWQIWREAEAVVGRLYRDKDGLGLEEWKEMFRGAVQRPNANDFQLTFEVISDTVSKGKIVCNRTLGELCGFPFKDIKTCGYDGVLTTCNHHLKSKHGCDGRGNGFAFGGTESRYNPDTDVPGTGGNILVAPGGRGCPKLDQYVLVADSRRNPVPKMVGFLTEDDYLFNPISKTFHKIKFLQMLKNVPIFEVISKSGAISYSSKSHLVLTDLEDNKGTAVADLNAQDSILTFSKSKIEKERFVLANESGETADVLRIEMEDGHIYASGDSTEKFIIAHNSKPNPYDPDYPGFETPGGDS